MMDGFNKHWTLCIGRELKCWTLHRPICVQSQIDMDIHWGLDFSMINSDDACHMRIIQLNPIIIHICKTCLRHWHSIHSPHISQTRWRNASRQVLYWLRIDCNCTKRHLFKHTQTHTSNSHKWTNQFMRASTDALDVTYDSDTSNHPTMFVYLEFPEFSMRYTTIRVHELLTLFRIGFHCRDVSWANTNSSVTTFVQRRWRKKSWATNYFSSVTNDVCSQRYRRIEKK